MKTPGSWQRRVASGKKHAGGRPALGPGRGRDGALVRARVDAKEKAAVVAYCKRAGLSEGELVREALIVAGVLKRRQRFELAAELLHPPEVVVEEETP